MKTDHPEKKQSIPACILAGLIVLLTVIGTCVMIRSRSKGLLIADGLENLKYYTVDSNLFVGVVHLGYLILAAARGVESNDSVQLWTERFIYIAVTAVSLTFVVVVLFFAPFVGLAPLMQDANLYFHLIIPVLAIVSFCAFHRDRAIPLWETALALIPPVLYGLYYTIVLLVKGVHFPFTDWYGFAAGGVWGSVLTAAMIFLLTWALALLLRLGVGGTLRQARRRTNRVSVPEN